MTERSDQYQRQHKKKGLMTDVMTTTLGEYQALVESQQATIDKLKDKKKFFRDKMSSKIGEIEVMQATITELETAFKESYIQGRITELEATITELEDEIARFRDPLAQGED